MKQYRRRGMEYTNVRRETKGEYKAEHGMRGKRRERTGNEKKLVELHGIKEVECNKEKRNGM